MFLMDVLVQLNKGMRVLLLDFFNGYSLFQLKKQLRFSKRRYSSVREFEEMH